MKDPVPPDRDLEPPNRGAWIWGFRRLYRPGRATTRGAPVAGRNKSTGFPVNHAGDDQNVAEGALGTSVFVRAAAEDADPIADNPTMFDYVLLEELLAADAAYRAALKAAVKAGMTPAAMTRLEAAMQAVVEGPLIERFLDFAERLVPLMAQAQALQALHAAAPVLEPKPEEMSRGG